MDEISAELTAIISKHPIAKNFWETPKEDTTELVRHISKNKDLECFNEHVHRLGDQGSSFSYTEFAEALVRRARVVGSEKTLKEVMGYINSQMLNLQYVFLLANVHIDDNYTFCNKVRLQKTFDLEDSSLKDHLVEQMRDPQIGSRRVYVVLCADYEAEKCHYPNTETGVGFNQNSMPPHQTIEDTRLILSLARSNFGIPLIASAVMVPKNLSFLETGVGQDSASEPTTHFGPSIIEFEIKLADRLLNKFEGLDEITKDRLRICLTRLNGAKIDPDPVNKSINLRICIENIFMNIGEQDNIRKKISERMGESTNFTKTRSKNVYKHLSHPIHSGRIQSHSTIRIEDIITELQKKAIKIIEDGAYPVWQAKKYNFRKNLLSCVFRARDS